MYYGTDYIYIRMINGEVITNRGRVGEKTKEYSRERYTIQTVINLLQAILTAIKEKLHCTSHGSTAGLGTVTEQCLATVRTTIRQDYPDLMECMTMASNYAVYW